MRHLKNFNELTLYAGISCALAWLTRVHPVLFYPVLFLRLGILGYCIYVVGNLENSKPTAVLIGSALFLGWMGGYWDFIEIQLTHNLTEIILTMTIVLVLFMVGFSLLLGVKNAK